MYPTRTLKISLQTLSSRDHFQSLDIFLPPLSPAHSLARDILLPTGTYPRRSPLFPNPLPHALLQTYLGLSQRGASSHRCVTVSLLLLVTVPSSIYAALFSLKKIMPLHLTPSPAPVTPLVSSEPPQHLLLLSHELATMSPPLGYADQKAYVFTSHYILWIQIWLSGFHCGFGGDGIDIGNGSVDLCWVGGIYCT